MLSRAPTSSDRPSSRNPWDANRLECGPRRCARHRSDQLHSKPARQLLPSARETESHRRVLLSSLRIEPARGTASYRSYSNQHSVAAGLPADSRTHDSAERNAPLESALDTTRRRCDRCDTPPRYTHHAPQPIAAGARDPRTAPARERQGPCGRRGAPRVLLGIRSCARELHDDRRNVVAAHAVECLLHERLTGAFRIVVGKMLRQIFIGELAVEAVAAQ